MNGTRAIRVLPPICCTGVQSVRFGCATAFGALAGADPAERETLLAATFGDWTAFCAAPCPVDLDALADLEPLQRTAGVLGACDRAGTDPVFGGPLAGLRASMPPLEYLATSAGSGTATSGSSAASPVSLATSSSAS